MLSRSLVITWLIAAAGFSGLMFGQQFTSGQISGFVLDPSAAGVPNAVVTAEETATHLSRQATSGENGYFAFAVLPVGAYSIAVEVTGFKRSLQSGLVLDAGSKLAVTVQLEIGSNRESVEVVTSRAPVESETAQVGRLVDQKQLLELPVNGRNMGNYLMLEPGVSNLRQPNVSAATDNFGIRRFSINGSNDSQTHVTVDGIEAIRTDGGGATIGMTSPDSLQEVRVLTSNYLAEYGRGGGAQVIYVTRSGTSAFHGGAYEFLQNDIFNARGYFATTVPKNRYNLFGGNLGGPVYIPGKWNKDKNKAFFFYSGEALLIRNETQAIALVPTAAQRAGNFSGAGTAPIDPLSGAPFPNAIIPAARMSRNGPALLNLYPAPNANLPGGNYSALGKNWTNQQIHQMKGDYDLGHTRISASVNLTRLDFQNAFRGSFALLPDLEHRYGYREGLTATTTLRPNLLNQFTFGYSTDHEALVRVGPGINRSTYGLDFPYVFPAAVKDGNKIPTLNVSGLGQIDGGNYILAGHRGPIFGAHDDVTWNRGGHTFKFGAVFERTGLNTSDQAKNDQNGNFTFAASSLNPRTTKNPIADVLLGNFDSYSEQGRSVFNVFRTNAFEAFVQDSWKVSRNLTLELGARYNLWQPYYEIWNAISYFDPRYYDPSKAPQINPSTGAIVPNTGDPYNGIVIPGSGWPDGAKGRFSFVDNPASQALFHNLPRGYTQTQTNLIDPRLGFAWSPLRDTVIRGGAGIFHTRDVFYTFASQGVNYPLVPTTTINYGSVDNPAGGTAATTFPVAVNQMSPDLKNPVLYQFSLGMQRRLPGNVLLDAAFVGQRGRDLYYNQPEGALPYNYCYNNRQTNCNVFQTYRGYSQVTLIGNRQFTNFNSMQLSARRQYANGFFVATNYTWSKNIERGQVRDPLNLNLDIGPSALTRTHVVNITFLYELPFWKQNRLFAARMLSGWSVSGITAFSTGLPMNVTLIGNIATLTGTATRPDLIANPNLPASQRNFNNYFNSSAFAQPAIGTLGNAGYDVLNGPGDNNWDLALLKNFHITEGFRIQFRSEMFNAFNHPEIAYNGVNTQWGSSLFGHVTAMNSSRVIQMSLKLNF